MAAPTDAEMRAWINKHVDADLQHILNDCGVTHARQYEIGQLYRTSLRFSTLADSRAEIRTALRQDFRLDADTPANRAEIAAIVAAWESSKHVVAEDFKHRTEAKHLGLTRPLAQSDRSAMVRALETLKGDTVSDRELPSAEYVAQLLEMVEQDDVTACALDEVISKSDAGTLNLQTSVDSAGRLRIARQRPKGRLPTTTEELRLKLKVESNAWLMISSKVRNRRFLHDLHPKHFDAFVDYLLGPKCYNLEIVNPAGERVPLRPPWPILLQYEFELRKRALKDAHRQNKPLSETLQLVCENSELKELYFTSPVALSGRTYDRSSDQPSKYLKGKSKGEADSKGKGRDQKGKGKGKQQRLFPGSTVPMTSTTPDGRQICYSFNTPGSKCDGRCKRVHICRAVGCGQKHPIYQHPGVPKADEAN